MSNHDPDTAQASENAMPQSQQPANTTASKCPWYYFAITDQFGAPVSGLNYVLTFPQGKKRIENKLSNTGVVEGKGPKGEYEFALKQIFSARWGTKNEVVKTLEVGKEVRLTAQLTGYGEGTNVTFEIFDACNPIGKPLDSIESKSGGTEVTANWQPDAQKLKGVNSGHVVFIAKAGGKQDATEAMSPPALIEAKQSYTIVGPDGKALKTKLTLHFSGRKKMEKQSDGGKVELLVPLGRHLLDIQLPDQSGAYAKFEANGQDKREFLTPKTS